MPDDEVEIHDMKETSEYAGSKEYYDYYNYYATCSCGWRVLLDRRGAAKALFSQHREGVILHKLGLRFNEL